MATDRWVGQILGNRYRIEELLGQGGMSAVYKATDPNLQRTVAVKLIHPHLSSNDEFIRRFESEATAIARLRHPNIVQVFDFNHDADLYYMVLEFVPGETLQSRIKRMNDSGRHLPIRDVLHFTIDICKAADYAHQRGLIHRDIKPANVMLDVNGNAILMDFGIARILGGQQHTATGAVLGTALYMSPEQIQGLHPDARSDIYSLGVTLFETLGGQPPFEADSAMTLMMKHLNDPVPDLSKLHPGIPEAVKAIVNRALEKDRANRFQTCAEMAAALQEALDQVGPKEDGQTQKPEKEMAAPPLPTLATIIETQSPAVRPPATLIEPAGVVPPPLASTVVAMRAEPRVEKPTVGATTVQNGTISPPEKVAKKNKVVLMAGLVVILLVLAGGSYFFLRQGNPEKTATPSDFVAAFATITRPPLAIATRANAEVVIPIPTVTETPAPTLTQTPEAANTATPPALVSPVIGGADKVAFLLGRNIWMANIDGSQ
ncbi:MAG: protein kinase, partial [Anaerolineaceae bacterium]|nr:protein kinase [Anaerolineaceae bacterium]